MTPGEQTRDYYRKQGREEEQERIVKLLEAYQSKKCNDYECFSGSNRNVHDYECGVDELERLIALIKGQA